MIPSWPLRISQNRRHLVDADGRPFFYLADTAWELFHRLSLDEARRYLGDRAARGFTAIQAVALAELDGLHTPNASGETPLVDDDPTRPNEAYFQHVDAVVRLAAELGLVMAMLPTWGDKWNTKWGVGPEIFTPENAAAYGEFLGRRYRDQPIIWVLGGDRPIETDGHRAIIDAMAEGLGRGDGGRHLKTYHPSGGKSSSEWFNDAAWLDFHMAQTGHSSNAEAFRFIEHDYALEPTRPCLNGEPCYEDIPERLSKEPDAPYIDADGVRKAAYWSVFAGALGHTYGCNPIWQMWAPGRKPVLGPRRPWWEAMDLPGASQMDHLRRLVESRPMLGRVPDQSLLSAADREAGTVRACRDESDRYAMVYAPDARSITVDLRRFPRGVRAWSYDVKQGVAKKIDQIADGGEHTFPPPAHGPDWVLVLDSATEGFAAPGDRRP